MNKEIRSVLITIVFLFFIYLLSFLGTGIDIEIKTFNAFNYLLGLSVVIQILFFIPSFLFKTEKLYDLIGSSTYLIVISYAYFSIDDKTVTDTLLFIFVSTWSVRLGTYLFTRINRACAAVIAILKNEKNSLNIFLILGSIVWIGGFTIEVIADLQKNKFKKIQDTNSKFISTGLWSKSRHPNYFGEISLWVGIYIISLPSFTGIEYLTLISPIFVCILLTRMSGINMLEKIADQRYGNLPEYQEYKKNTPVLIPYKLKK